VEGLVAAFSRTGEHGLAWHIVAAAGIVLDAERRPVYRRALIATLSAYAANQAIKLAVRRPRPRLEDLPPLTDTLTELSYPSAHAATSFAAARALSPALPAPGLYAAAGVMALSRPYLGVHYVSDSVAGAALGYAVARLLR
jgi:decaprenylphosphoryl-5-phosphoribose phosphatase